MNKYKSKPINYDGCDLIIAEHLKQGKAILCNVWDNEENQRQEYVTCFDIDNTPNCYGTEESVWRYATPVEQTQYVKKASEIVVVLESLGCEAHNMGWHIDGRMIFFHNSFSLCGKEYNPELNIREEFLERREIK